jgi:hypothetical protein
LKKRLTPGERAEIAAAEPHKYPVAERLGASLNNAYVIRCAARKQQCEAKKLLPADTPDTIIQEFCLDRTKLVGAHDPELLSVLKAAVDARALDPTFVIDLHLDVDGSVLSLFWCSGGERTVLYRYGHLLFIDSKH